MFQSFKTLSLSTLNYEVPRFLAVHSLLVTAKFACELEKQLGVPHLKDFASSKTDSYLWRCKWQILRWANGPSYFADGCFSSAAVRTVGLQMLQPVTWRTHPLVMRDAAIHRKYHYCTSERNDADTAERRDEMNPTPCVATLTHDDIGSAM